MTKYDIVPRGGFVIVGRNEVDPYVKLNGAYVIGNNLQKVEKHPMDIRIEELQNVYATVFSVGGADPRTGEQFEGVKGQRVIIAPEVFIPIHLDDGDRVWLGPMAGVKAFFVEVEEKVLGRSYGSRVVEWAIQLWAYLQRPVP
jgi:hypothetical protein